MRGLLLGLAACAVDVDVEGETVLELGTGEYAFEPVVDEMEVPIVHGPQGGDHVWLGLRVSGVSPKRFRAETVSFYTARDLQVGEPLFFEFNLLEDEGGWFYAGLPHVVEPSDVHGKKIRFVMEVTDREGRTARDTIVVVPRKPEW